MNSLILGVTASNIAFLALSSATSRSFLASAIACLNNSLIFEDYNRTENVSDIHPKRIERNLDYFYTINSATSSYLHHTLHVEGFTYSSIDNTFKFELDKYWKLELGLVTGYTSEELESDEELWFIMVHEDDKKHVLNQAFR